MLLSLFAITSAFAQPVVHDGDGNDAVERVRNAVPDAGELEPVSLASIVVAQPPTFTGGGLMRCTGEAVDLVTVQIALEGADKKLLDGDLDGALTALSGTEGQLACLNEPVKRSVAARLYFLRGVVSHALDSQPAAIKAFQRARGLDPELIWDENFPPHAKGVFDVTGAAGRVMVDVIPMPPRLTIDGEPAESPLMVSPGVHLVGFGKTTLMIDVQGDGRLTYPPQWASEGFGQLHQQANQQALEAHLGVDKPAYVVADDVWLVNDTWTRLDSPSGRGVGGKGSLYAGLGAAGAIFATGAAAFAGGYLTERQVQSDLQGGATVDSVSSGVARGNALYGVGYAGMGVGAGLAAVSVVVFR